MEALKDATRDVQAEIIDLKESSMNNQLTKQELKEILLSNVATKSDVQSLKEILSRKMEWQQPIPLYTTNRTIHADEGDDVEIWCVVRGIPTPQIKWTKDNNGKMASNRVEYEHEGTIMRIKKVGRSDTGTYVCVANNGIGTPVSQSFSLEVSIPVVLEKKIVEQAQLKYGTETWERWSNVTTPIFMSFRIFNTTNPHEVAIGRKPKLEEFGPYVYEEKRVKIDVELNEENNTVSYRQPVHYFFRPDLSNGTEEDRFKILNIPLVMLTTQGADMGFMAQLLLGGVVDEHDEEELFMEITVGQLLFKGKYVPMMKTLEVDTGKVLLKNNTFGLFYPKNGSDEGVLEVKTGVDDPSNFGKIVSWNGQTELSFWTDKYCNMINGTDGSMFPPFVTRERVVRLFSADLCRSLNLKYTQDVEMNGIHGYRFAVPKAELEDPRINEENSCFCTNPGDNKANCLKAGAIQLSACRKGTPVVLSTPHFYDGSEEYQNMTEGMKPDRERHLTFVDLEPNTGLVLNFHKRIQVNIELKANTIANDFADVPEIIYPILWADEGAMMAEPTQAAVKGMILSKSAATR